MKPIDPAGPITPARDYAVLDNTVRARELGEGALTRLRRVLGDSHPVSLGCAANLILDLRSAGEETTAERLSVDTMKRYRQTLGNDHPDTALAPI